MNKTELVTYLRKPTKISNEQLVDLEKIVDEYPYFLSARLLLAKASKELNHSKTKRHIASAAIYSTDRVLLKKYLSGELFFLSEPPKAAPIRERKVPTKKAVEPHEKSKSVPKQSVKNGEERVKSVATNRKPSQLEIPEVPSGHLDAILEELQRDLENLKSSREKFVHVQQQIVEDDAVSDALKKVKTKEEVKKEAEPKEKSFEESTEPITIKKPKAPKTKDTQDDDDASVAKEKVSAIAKAVIEKAKKEVDEEDKKTDGTGKEDEDSFEDAFDEAFDKVSTKKDTTPAKETQKTESTADEDEFLEDEADDFDFDDFEAAFDEGIEVKKSEKVDTSSNNEKPILEAKTDAEPKDEIELKEQTKTKSKKASSGNKKESTLEKESEKPEKKKTRATRKTKSEQEEDRTERNKREPRFSRFETRSTLTPPEDFDTSFLDVEDEDNKAIKSTPTKPEETKQVAQETTGKKTETQSKASSGKVESNQESESIPITPSPSNKEKKQTPISASEDEHTKKYNLPDLSKAKPVARKNPRRKKKDINIGLEEETKEQVDQNKTITTEEEKKNEKVTSSTMDSLEKKSISKDDQIEIIDKFIEDSPTIKYQRKGDTSPQDLSEQSGAWDSTLSSEYLAEIYLNQGNKKRATEIYNALSLKYPEKKSYFADLISKIR